MSAKNIYKVIRVWRAAEDAAPPAMPEGKGSVRATLRAPPWTARGYSAQSAGFVWWSFARRPEGALLRHGEEIVHELRSLEARATTVHLFSHRYARGKPESTKDKLTYHSAVIVEWDHGR